MEVLNQISTPEVYLILNGNKATLRELLKFTLLDLITKKVLKATNIEHHPSPQDPISYIRQISIGDNFKNYSAKPHELVFIRTLSTNQIEANYLDTPAYLLLRHLIIIVYQNIKSRKNYIFNHLALNQEVKANIKTALLFSTLGYVQRTEKGKILKQRIRNEIAFLEKKLPDLIKSKSIEAVKILNQINGNVFLLTGFDFDLLKNIDTEFINAIKKAKEIDASLLDYFDGFFDFSSYSTAFDTDFASAAGDFGDSGGSGCSGCSGCGGCGGCGG